MTTSDEAVKHLIAQVATSHSAKALGPWLQLLEYAKRDLASGRNENDFQNFLVRWYGNNPGFFWNIWDEISDRANHTLVWSREPVRQLLFLPADHIVDIAKLSATTDSVAESFRDWRAYLDVMAEAADDAARVQLLKLFWQGREGASKKIRDGLLHTPGNLRPVFGKQFNDFTTYLNLVLTRLEEVCETRSGKVRSSELDLSLPGIERAIGTRHLIRQTYDELLRIFTAIGFSVVAGPEIETPYYNFEALNIPEHHPARDNMDTFYIEGARGGHLLRTHTSPMQIRTMEKQKPPVRIVVPGKVYRRDNPDATHGYMFHQIEGLAVDTDITFCDFKGTVDYFAREFLGPKTKTRLRPSYFPFTEPSAEVDATCHVCGGSGCRVCKQSGWIELFGAGMVNPAVYGFVGYDPEKYSGFAFGMGVDRLAMMKYGVTEVPLLFQNDVRFLKQFP
jgi:phenylalanyl-tRNA synthetase alpha chain